MWETRTTATNEVSERVCLSSSVFAAMELSLRFQAFLPKDHCVQTVVTEALRTCMNSPMENNVKTYNELDPGFISLSL